MVSFLTKKVLDSLGKSTEFMHLLEKCSEKEKKEVFEFVMGIQNIDSNSYNPDDEKPRPMIYCNIHFLQEQEQVYTRGVR